MTNFANWLRNQMARLKSALQHFMLGRYGTDKLNTWILTTGVIVCLLGLFIGFLPLRGVMTLVSYGLMIWAIYRSFSRNVYKRYQENRRFLQLLDRVKDRQHRYFDCPHCRQPVRVPRGKGKIAITCPKCREKFVRKT